MKHRKLINSIIDKELDKFLAANAETTEPEAVGFLAGKVQSALKDDPALAKLVAAELVAIRYRETCKKRPDFLTDDLQLTMEGLGNTYLPRREGGHVRADSAKLDPLLFHMENSNTSLRRQVLANGHLNGVVHRLLTDGKMAGGLVNLFDAIKALIKKDSDK